MKKSSISDQGLLCCVRILLFFTVISNGVVAQDSWRQWSLTFNGLVTPGLNIDRSYSPVPGTDIESRRALGYEWRLAYSHPVSKKWYLQYGLISGKQATSYDLYISEDFFETGWETEGLHGPYREWDIRYKGASLTVQGSIFQKENLKLTVGGGVNGIFYYPTFIEHYFDVILDRHGPKERLFNTLLDLNQKKTIIIAPEISGQMDYAFSEKFGMQYRIMASASWPDILVQEEGTSYQIFGNDRILEGKMSKKHIYVGLGLGLYYRFLKEGKLNPKR